MIYFDNAATSRFKPKAAAKELVKAFKNSANPGRGAHDESIKSSLVCENTRAFLLEKLGATDCGELVFTKNCTEALNLAIFGTVVEGKHVVTTALEHNSVLRPLFKLKDEGLITLSVLNPDRSGKINPKHFERMLTDDTYLAAITAQSNVTGEITDLKTIGKICAANGVMLLADGAQAIPNVDVDFEKFNLTMLAAPGHKGLHGPQGTGFLIFRRNLKIKPLLYGGTGTNSDSVYMPHTPPESLEAGTLNATGIAALLEGAKQSFADVDRNRKKIAKVSDYILKELQKLPTSVLYTNPSNLSGIISFNLKGVDSTTVGDVLNRKYKIAVRTGLHCAPLTHNMLGTLESGAVRISVGADNTLKQAKKLIKALTAISDKICQEKGFVF